MKRSILLIILASLCLSAGAQNSLKGSWTSSESSMGVVFTDVLSFESNLNGQVLEKETIILNTNILGTDISGEAIITKKGEFSFTDGTLSIKWVPEAIQFEIVRPVVATRKGKPSPEMTKQAEDMFFTVVEELKKSAQEKDIYDSVSISNGKLSIKTKNRKGKKYSRSFTYLP